MALYAFDGTWNKAVIDDGVEGGEDTNVVHFYQAYQGPKWYVAGPGTRIGSIGRVLGGIAGLGATLRLEQAYAQLVSNYEAGDQVIDIVGFSRGAAIALDFANLIRLNGIWKRATEQVIAPRAAIRFLGLWDVVGSFGIPVGCIFQKLNIGHRLSVPENVEYAFHALAMDERRQSFRPTRQPDAYEVWFRGVHSDVGGGNGNAGLSCIALRWMLRKAKAAGLPIDEQAIAQLDQRIDPQAPLCLPSDYIVNAYRPLQDNDRFHYTVSERPDHNNAPPGGVVESDDDERTNAPRVKVRPDEPPPAPNWADPNAGNFVLGD